MSQGPNTHHTWLPIDSRRALSAADAALVTRFGESLMAGNRLHLEVPALMHLMRDAMAGQPRAAHTGERGAPRPWCWDHEQTVDRCLADDRLCSGEVIAHHDPAGDAAVSGDQAAGDLRRLRKLLEMHCRVIHEATVIAQRYPAQATQRADIPATPGEDWCRSCWRDGKYHEPVTRRANGTPYYRGLCRWCGQLARDLGTTLPPLELVERRHRGERITEGMVAQHRRAKSRKRSRAGST